jgi:small-conductance mechanosensitive channel/CRP-like cAMP-binding protein
LEQVLPAVGLFGILACTAFVVVRVATAYVSGKVHRVRASAELLVFLLVVYVLIPPGLHFVDAAHLIEVLENSVLSAAAFCLAFFVNGVLRVVLWDGLLSRHGERTVPVLVTKGVGFSIYLVAILLVMHFVYEESVGGLLATSGVAALVFGFAAQSTLREVFSGLALNATQALRIGDYVEIDSIYGQVYEINWRSISIKNPHTDSLYIFPNSGVADRTILNFSEPTGRFKYFVRFIVELSAPPELVIRAIAKELEHSRFVRREPKPDFNMLGYTKEGVEIRVRYYFDGDDPWWDAQNEVVMAIWTAMRKHRLRIAVNRTWLGSGEEWGELERRNEADFTPERVAEGLRGAGIFSGCEQGALAELAASADVLSLNPPGCFYEPGDPADGLYLVLDGKVALHRPLADPPGKEIKLESCTEGELFGLQSYIEGTPRKYLAQAEQYSVVAHLKGDAVRALEETHPDVTGRLAVALEARARRREEDAAVAHKALLAALHADERRRLSEAIRENVNEMLERPALHHFISLLSARVRHEDILNAVVAGAAIIAACRGAVDEEEEHFLRRAMVDADLLRHMDLEQALERFRKFARADDAANPDGSVYAMLDRAGEVKGGQRIVLAIAVGMSGVHGTPTEDEREALAAIAARLGLEPPEAAREARRPNLH